MGIDGFGIVVQARTGSTRLKNKMLLPFGKEKTLLGFILSRISKFTSLPIILATSNNDGDKVLGEIASQYNIPTYYGSENDVLLRFLGATKSMSFNRIIRICADNPFLSMEYLQELIMEFDKRPELDYLSFVKKDGTPVMKSHLGYFAEAVKSSTLLKANELTDSPFYHEHVTNFIYENNDIFNVDFLSVPEDLDKDDYRLTLDTEEDYNMLLGLEQKVSDKYKDNYRAIEVLDMVGKLKLNDKMEIIINDNSK